MVDTNEDLVGRYARKRSITTAAATCKGCGGVLGLVVPHMGLTVYVLVDVSNSSLTRAEYVDVFATYNDGLSLYCFLRELVQVFRPIRIDMDIQGSMLIAKNDPIIST